MEYILSLLAGLSFFFFYVFVVYALLQIIDRLDAIADKLGIENTK